MADNADKKWYAMRVSYVHASKYSLCLKGELKEYFVPPVITNLLFIHATRAGIEDFMQHYTDGSKLSFMWDKCTNGPIVVRDKDMASFMQLCLVAASSSKDGAPIVMSECPDVKLGDHVRVKEGPLKGIEGHVVRIRKSRRILVNLSNVVWAATEFVHPDLLEVIDD